MADGDTLAIIAGGGPLPLSVARAARESGRDVFVIVLEGLADACFRDYPHARLGIAQTSAMIKAMHAAGCRDLVMIGTARRPGKLRIRDVGLPLIWTLLKNIDILWSGDASLLGKIIRIFESEGFKVRGAHEIAPQLLIPVGQHGRISPNARDQRDIEIGIKAARHLGELDIGQGVIVARGRVLAVEAAEGTDAMLERVAGLNKAHKDKRIGVLVKWPQPIQDLRIDMPTIGPRTMCLAAEANLAGIAVAGGRVLGVNVDEMIDLANQHGLFLTAVDPDGQSNSWP